MAIKEQLRQAETQIEETLAALAESGIRIFRVQVLNPGSSAPAITLIVDEKGGQA